MAEIIKEEMDTKNIEIKEEILEIILPSSTVEDTCTVYIKEEGLRNEITGMKGNI